MTAPFAAAPDYPRWPEVAELIRDAFAYMTPLLGHPPRAAALTAADLSQATATGTAYLIEDDDRPVACVFTRPSRDVPQALYIGWLAVAERMRGQGLAAKLIDAARVQARQNGYTALTLDTGRPLTRLHGIFEGMGFVMQAGDDEVVTFIRPLP